MFAGTNGKTQVAKFITPGEGETFSMLGVRITPKVVAEDTNGAFSLIEQVVQPGGGSPPHILHRDDKVIYVIEGEFAILLGNETVTATAGSCAIIPKGVLHNFKNVGASAGKILVSLTPGGHEKFLRDLSQVAQAGPPDRDKMMAIGKNYHVEIVPPKAG